MAISIKRATVFADGLDHPECLAAHPDGSIYAGGEAGQIYRVSADGKRVEEIASTGGFILGVAISPDAKWLAVCDLKKQCVWRLDLSSRTLSEFARGAGGPKFLVSKYMGFSRGRSLVFTRNRRIRPGY